MLKWDYKLRVDLFRQIHDLCTDGCVPKQLMIMAFDFHNCHVKNDFEQFTFYCVVYEMNQKTNIFLVALVAFQCTIRILLISDEQVAYQPWKLDENVKNRINCFYLCTILSILGWSLQFLFSWCNDAYLMFRVIYDVSNLNVLLFLVKTWQNILIVVLLRDRDYLLTQTVYKRKICW